MTPLRRSGRGIDCGTRAGTGPSHPRFANWPDGFHRNWPYAAVARSTTLSTFAAGCWMLHVRRLKSMEKLGMQDMASACHSIERMLARYGTEGADVSKVAARNGKAILKSLESSMILLGVARQLMLSDSATPKDYQERMSALTEEIKNAARTAYQAGLLLNSRD